MGVAVTAGIYGVVALLVKMDDVGRWLSRRGRTLARIGNLLIRAMPAIFQTLSLVGTAAMLWVGGGILVHGLAAFGISRPEHWIHALATAMTPTQAVVWTVTAMANGVTGLCAGAVIVTALHLSPLKKHE